MKSKQMEECLAYFQNRPVYDKLFRKVRDKYASLGHMGGSVVLTRLTDTDKQQLGGFFKKDYHDNRSVTISADLMHKALADSRFAELRWEDILTAYFGEPLKTKEEQRQKETDQRRQYFAEILDEMEDKGREWLAHALKNRDHGYQILQQQYKEDPDGLKQTLAHLDRAISRLPVWEGQTERLAVFAANITGNPHYFDEAMLGERLLLAYLQSVFPNALSGEARAEKKSSLLYAAGILKDDLSNFVLTYGICGQGKNDELHVGIAGFLRQQEPVILTLYTVSRLKKAAAQESSDGNIYVVENPAVFAALVEKYPWAAVICTNGQPRLSALALMDLLRDDHIFYYSGDFDPEGLRIAQNLKERYREKLIFWNYDAAYYEQAISDVDLDEVRLRKLERVHMEELQGIKKAILERKRAAYQENMLEQYIIVSTKNR